VAEHDAGADDGRRDFDFIMGTWHIAHHRLADPLDPACDRWDRFAGRSEVGPVLGEFGHVDRTWVPAWPGGGELEGYTLRLFDPETRSWRIYWSSTRAPGRLDPPMLGRFVDGVGQFLGHDELGGTPVDVRFTWDSVTPTSARWRQEFSWDAGATWAHNWTMEFTRA